MLLVLVPVFSPKSTCVINVVPISCYYTVPMVRGWVPVNLQTCGPGPA